MDVSVIKKDEWIDSWQMHRCYAKSFHGERPAKIERPDFVLLCKEHEKIVGFITCIEMDSETLYWQFGGVFDEIKNTVTVRRALLACHKTAAELGFKRITTRVENNNMPMLRLHMKFGFLIVGTYSFKNKIYLEMLNDTLGEQCL